MADRPNAAPRTSRKAALIRIAVTAIITVAITIGATLLSTTSGGFASDPAAGKRTWTLPIIAHLATVVPAFLIGAALFLMPKGTPLHRRMGRVYAALMLVTATATVFIGTPGAGIMGSGFSFIHIFTVMTFLGMPYAIWAARTGRIEAHRGAMQGMYIGLCIAGGFAMIPGRLLYPALFG